MKTCPHCNSSCEDTDIVCKNCGYLFNAENIPYPPESGAEQQTRQQQTYRQPESDYHLPVQNNYSQPDTNNFQAVPDNNKSSGLSIAGFVLGLIGTLFCWCYGFGLLPSIPGLILSIISMNKCKISSQSGKGFAIAGIILSVLGILASIGFIIVYVYFLTSPEGKNLISQYSHMYSSAARS